MPVSLGKLCIHTITTKPWSLETAAQKYSAAGVKGISIWLDAARAHADGGDYAEGGHPGVIFLSATEHQNDGSDQKFNKRIHITHL